MLDTTISCQRYFIDILCICIFAYIAYISYSCMPICVCVNTQEKELQTFFLLGQKLRVKKLIKLINICLRICYIPQLFSSRMFLDKVCGPFKELLGGIPWTRALKGRGVQECWSLFKHHFLHAQERCISLRKKSSKGGRRPAWLNKELLAKLRWKRKVHGMWKEGQAT